MAASGKHIIVGTAGHIDHGKSALVEALTGTNPDRLEEEKRRGITIDLGFAFLELEDVKFGFVDVPGHERFVRNMLAGAGGIDVLILVVAADESIKPQTREHFDICRLLGIPRGIVAITKSDLVDADMVGLVRLEIEEFVRGSFLEGAPIVPVSAKTGAGLDALKKELLRAAHEAPAKDVTRHFRLPIDRSFATKGFGTVVTGTLISGSVKVKDEIEIYPVRRRVRVRGLHSGGKPIERAVAGQRTAVNLQGIDHGDVKRGMVLAPPGIFTSTKRVDARITLLQSARPLKNRTRAHFHEGAAETIAEAILLDRAELAPGDSALVQLRLDDEILLLPGDRFILRQFSPVVTIGGGVVVDARPARHRRNDPAVGEFLEKIEHGGAEEVIAAIADATPRGLTLEDMVARTGWLEADVRAAVKKLVDQKKLRILTEQPLVVAPEAAMTKAASAILEAVDRFHRDNPLLPGIPKQELRGRAGKPRVELFEAALGDLVKRRAVSVAGDLVQRAGREIALSADEARAKEMISGEFERAGLTVPSMTAVLGKLPVETARAQKILQILLREKVLVKVADDLVFHREALAQLRVLLAKYSKEKGNRLPITAFKELAGISRKYAIPLLEHLDREHVTRRAGDERVIL
ncbi:MAG TPA: selenocysteine-specific translation elongation factor [Candidatus Acidoferrales bacterium]|jgi:selenocysteine-specific elongation factor|nr:selenocysteine-specific translation elongation factor [Candidatus Acidoferrales bacterium]